MRQTVVGFVIVLAAFALALPADASLQLSLGIRETGAGGGPDGPIGENAGVLGGIEWVNLDGQTIPFDGQWHAYSWDLDADPLTAFAGGTANGVLDGLYGSIENLRFRNINNITQPITVWVDGVTNVTSAGSVVFGGFEGYTEGAEVMFQEPSFSGSTAHFIVAGSTAGVDLSTAYEGAASYRANWQFVNDPTSWLRFTTYQTPIQGNPRIRFDQDSVVTVYIKAIPEPTTFAALAAGLALLGLRRR